MTENLKCEFSIFSVSEKSFFTQIPHCPEIYFHAAKKGVCVLLVYSFCIVSVIEITETLLKYYLKYEYGVVKISGR
jgi:hypothetical protein